MSAILLPKKGGNVMRAVESPDERRDEVDRILDNLRRVVHALYSNSRVVERLAGMTSAQAWLIATLSRMETPEITDLARAMHLRPSAVIRIVGRLEERGLVVRIRSSNDRGIAKVALTHVGMKLAGRLPAVPQEHLLKNLSEVPPGRLRAISEGLDSLVGTLGARALTPRLFFAPVSNLQVGDSNAGQRVERRFPGTVTILGSGRHGRGRRTRGKGKGHDPESIHSESGRPARAS